MLQQPKALIVGIIIALNTVCYAGNFVTLSGDLIEMDNVKKVVIASDNVGILFNDYKIETSRFEYWKPQKHIYLPNPFELTSKEITFNAREFYYNTGSLQGQAHYFDTVISRLKISGEYIEFGPQKVIIKNARFTTCDNAQSTTHYYVKAKTIYLYPQWGFFVAFNSKVYARFIPGYIPIPTYIYGSKQYSLVEATTLMPNVGTNKTEGIYIKENMGYFINQNSSGAVSVGTSKKLGAFVGINHAFTLKNRQQLNIKAAYTKEDFFEGKVLYQFKLLEKKKEKETSMLKRLVSNFSESKNDTLSDIKVLYQHREVENDRRVSYKPTVTFDTHRIPLSKEIFLTSSAIFGQVEEERQPELRRNERPTFSAWRSTFYGTLTSPVKLNESINLSTELSFYGNWYDTGDTWQRLFTTFSFSWPKIALEPELRYVKRLLPIIGDTPFEFEKNYALKTDELGIVLKKTFEKTFYRLEANYNLEPQEEGFSDRLRTFDIVSGIALHCWRLSLRWQTQQQSVSFSVDLY